MAKDTNNIDRQPTPPIGWPIVWHRNAKKPSDPLSGTVTGIEDVGKLVITIFPPNGMQEHKKGVLHVSNKVHSRPASSHNIRNGAWDFIDGLTPKHSYKMSDEREVRKEAARKEMEALNARVAAERLERESKPDLEAV